MTQREANNLVQRIEHFQDKRILIFSDLVADAYIYCQSSRVSREAPVLILTYQHSTFRPGGGANSIANLSALGAQPIPFGYIGEDEYGKQLLTHFQQQGITTRHIRVDSGYHTVTKTRILAGGTHTVKQQIVRIDRESIYSFTAKEEGELLQALQASLDQIDAILISDYGYGTVQQNITTGLIEEAKRRNRLVILDSRHNLLHFPGVTAATPNQQEVEECLQLNIDNDPEALDRGGKTLLEKLQAEAILITRGSLGMSLFRPNTSRKDIPVFGTKEVADVTGAGDTVASTFTLALASGASYEEAALLANYAGGIVVMKHGTATLTQSELEEAILGEKRSSAS